MSKTVQERIDACLISDCPKFYSNGFTIAVSNVDVLIVFEKNDRPELAINLPHSFLKLLHDKTKQALDAVESQKKVTPEQEPK